MSFEISDFQKDVIERSNEIPVLVDFWAEWCGPCRTLGPVLERLAAQANGRWELAKVDTERHTRIAAQYGIRSIPNVKLFVDGKPAAEFTGALPESAVRQWLEKNLPDPLRHEAAEAERLLRSGMREEAIRILRGILERRPEQEQATVLMAQAMLHDDPDGAVEMVNHLDESSPLHYMVESIRTFGEIVKKSMHPEQLPEHPVRETYVGAMERVRERDFDGALERYIQVIREHRYYDDDGSRKACIAIFRLLGEEHETTLRYRRDFNSSLY